MERIECGTMAEYNACIAAGNIAVIFDLSVRAWDNATVVAGGNATVVARGNASVTARGNASVTARDNATVTARDNASVTARNNASVEALGNASVTAGDNATVTAWDNASVTAGDNASVMAWDNASVKAWGNASVKAGDNATVMAWDNASVTAWGNVFVRLFSALIVKASAHVVVMRHNDDPGTVTGGVQVKAAPLPEIGSEWCEYYGISPDAPYAVKNIDAAILSAIENKMAGLDMDSWHGQPCDETNWCKTTHCRAGFAICLAGKPGFELAKTYGDETAGRMIYAVSRPDRPLPVFHASNTTAMADIRASAESAKKMAS